VTSPEWFAVPDGEPAAPAYAHSMLSILRRHQASWVVGDLRPEDTTALTRYGLLSLLVDVCDYEEKLIMATLRVDVGDGWAKAAWCAASRADVDADIDECTGFRGRTLTNPTVADLAGWICEQLSAPVVRVTWFDNFDEEGARAWIAHADAMVLVWSGNRELIDGEREADSVVQVR
jgi:hypothetical protein